MFTCARSVWTPWAYIGFESVSHGSEEFAFSRDKSKRVLVAVVVTTFLLYVFLIIISVSTYPERYDSWLSYLWDLSNLEGIEAIPFFAAQRHLGSAGVIMLMLALLAIVSDYRYVRRRQEMSHRELGEVREVAYTDQLTHVKNRSSFMQWEARLNDEIAREASGPFAVAVCDVNGLKQINDTLGHKAGDRYIQQASNIICVFFKRSPVFRIGGDEFAVILRGKDYDERETIVHEFTSEIERNKGTDEPVIAIGVAEFSADVDYMFQSVVERADAAMYAHKRQLKEC